MKGAVMSHTTVFIPEYMVLTETIRTSEFTQWQVTGRGLSHQPQPEPSLRFQMVTRSQTTDWGEHQFYSIPALTNNNLI